MIDSKELDFGFALLSDLYRRHQHFYTMAKHVRSLYEQLRKNCVEKHEDSKALWTTGAGCGSDQCLFSSDREFPMMKCRQEGCSKRCHVSCGYFERFDSVTISDGFSYYCENHNKSLLLCKCQTVYDQDRDMKQCDECQWWYHPDCQDEVDTDLSENWECESCKDVKQRHKKSPSKVSAILEERKAQGIEKDRLSTQNGFGQADREHIVSHFHKIAEYFDLTETAQKRDLTIPEQKAMIEFSTRKLAYLLLQMQNIQDRYDNEGADLERENGTTESFLQYRKNPILKNFHKHLAEKCEAYIKWVKCTGECVETFLVTASVEMTQESWKVNVVAIDTLEMGLQNLPQDGLESISDKDKHFYTALCSGLDWLQKLAKVIQGDENDNQRSSDPSKRITYQQFENVRKVYHDFQSNNLPNVLRDGLCCYDDCPGMFPECFKKVVYDFFLPMSENLKESIASMSNSKDYISRCINGTKFPLEDVKDLELKTRTTYPIVFNSLPLLQEYIKNAEEIYAEVSQWLDSPAESNLDTIEKDLSDMRSKLKCAKGIILPTKHLEIMGELLEFSQGLDFNDETAKVRIKIEDANKIKSNFAQIKKNVLENRTNKTSTILEQVEADMQKLNNMLLQAKDANNEAIDAIISENNEKVKETLSKFRNMRLTSIFEEALILQKESNEALEKFKLKDEDESNLDTGAFAQETFTELRERMKIIAKKLIAETANKDKMQSMLNKLKKTDVVILNRNADYMKIFFEAKETWENLHKRLIQCREGELLVTEEKLVELEAAAKKTGKSRLDTKNLLQEMRTNAASLYIKIDAALQVPIKTYIEQASVLTGKDNGLALVIKIRRLAFQAKHVICNDVARLRALERCLLVCRLYVILNHLDAGAHISELRCYIEDDYTKDLDTSELGSHSGIDVDSSTGSIKVIKVLTADLQLYRAVESLGQVLVAQTGPHDDDSVTYATGQVLECLSVFLLRAEIRYTLDNKGDVAIAKKLIDDSKRLLDSSAPSPISRRYFDLFTKWVEKEQLQTELSKMTKWEKETDEEMLKFSCIVDKYNKNVCVGESPSIPITDGVVLKAVILNWIADEQVLHSKLALQNLLGQHQKAMLSHNALASSVENIQKILECLGEICAPICQIWKMMRTEMSDEDNIAAENGSEHERIERKELSRQTSMIRNVPYTFLYSGQGKVFMLLQAIQLAYGNLDDDTNAWCRKYDKITSRPGTRRGNTMSVTIDEATEALNDPIALVVESDIRKGLLEIVTGGKHFKKKVHNFLFPFTAASLDDSQDLNNSQNSSLNDDNSVDQASCFDSDDESDDESMESWKLAKKASKMHVEGTTLNADVQTELYLLEWAESVFKWTVSAPTSLSKPVQVSDPVTNKEKERRLTRGVDFNDARKLIEDGIAIMNLYELPLLGQYGMLTDDASVEPPSLLLNPKIPIPMFNDDTHGILSAAVDTLVTLDKDYNRAIASFAEISAYWESAKLEILMRAEPNVRKDQFLFINEKEKDKSKLIYECKRKISDFNAKSIVNINSRFLLFYEENKRSRGAEAVIKSEDRFQAGPSKMVKSAKAASSKQTSTGKYKPTVVASSDEDRGNADNSSDSDSDSSSSSSSSSSRSESVSSEGDAEIENKEKNYDEDFYYGKSKKLEKAGKTKRASSNGDRKKRDATEARVARKTDPKDAKRAKKEKDVKQTSKYMLEKGRNEAEKARVVRMIRNCGDCKQPLDPMRNHERLCDVCCHNQGPALYAALISYRKALSSSALAALHSHSHSSVSGVSLPLPPPAPIDGSGGVSPSLSQGTSLADRTAFSPHAPAEKSSVWSIQHAKKAVRRSVEQAVRVAQLDQQSVVNLRYKNFSGLVSNPGERIDQDKKAESEKAERSLRKLVNTVFDPADNNNNDNTDTLKAAGAKPGAKRDEAFDMMLQHLPKAAVSVHSNIKDSKDSKGSVPVMDGTQLLRLRWVKALTGVLVGHFDATTEGERALALMHGAVHGKLFEAALWARSEEEHKLKRQDDKVVKYRELARLYHGRFKNRNLDYITSGIVEGLGKEGYTRFMAMEDSQWITEQKRFQQQTTQADLMKVSITFNFSLLVASCVM